MIWCSRARLWSQMVLHTNSTSLLLELDPLIRRRHVQVGGSILAETGSLKVLFCLKIGMILGSCMKHIRRCQMIWVEVLKRPVCACTGAVKKRKGFSNRCIKLIRTDLILAVHIGVKTLGGHVEHSRSVDCREWRSRVGTLLQCVELR